MDSYKYRTNANNRWQKCLKKDLVFPLVFHYNNNRFISLHHSDYLSSGIHHFDNLQEYFIPTLCNLFVISILFSGVRSSERLQKLHDHVHVKPDEFAKNCMTKGIDQNGFSVMWINEIKGKSNSLASDVNKRISKRNHAVHLVGNT